MSIIRTKSLFRTVLTSVLFVSAGHAYAATDCDSEPVNPQGGTASDLRTALQQASNTGKTVRITGVYNIGSPINITIRGPLTVNASSAVFLATSTLDGDMFSLDTQMGLANDCGYPGKVDISWLGGGFNVSLAKVATVVPLSHLTPDGREGEAATADMLSIRGHAGTPPATTLQKVRNVTIDGVTMVGTSSNTGKFFEAGGDSGIFIMGAVSGTVKNSVFKGIRDAAIYLSADPADIYGGNYTAINNDIERTYAGISSKRGADNIAIRDNTLTDVVLGISALPTTEDRGVAKDIEITGNTIRRAARGILVQKAEDARIDSNSIVELGGIVAGLDYPITPHPGGVYEAVALEGVLGENQFANNIIRGITGPRENTTMTHGLVRRVLEPEQRGNSVPTRANNVFTDIDKPFVPGC